ncbi:MAG: site-2 protease family protein [Oscillospiraceae bacterium]|jgi:regulator of sigma E protease|nr:site-2 protease family protein [Oscillospiraceae bacterium]
MSILIAIIIFAVIILIHEIGHFTAAKLFKMRVVSFNLGMGPVLLRKRGKETAYQIKAVPFGGSVQLAEDDEDAAEKDPHVFRNKPVWQRAIVIMAGAFMNIVLGFILCLFIVNMNDSEMVDTVEIRGFREGAASNHQLSAGDRITHINGMRIFTWADISYQFYNTETRMSADADMAVFDFTVVRNGERAQLNNVHFYARELETGGKAIFLDFGVEWVDKTFFNVISRAAKETLTYSRLVLLTLFDMIRGTYGLNDIAGPVGVVTVIGEVSSEGFERSIAEGIRSSLFMAALITVNVGIFNLLPIPALDGGKLVFFAIEAVRRKPIKEEIEGMIHLVGFAALMVFMLLITVLDIGRLFNS